METNNVFLDTTEFDGNAFNYKSKKFSSLLKKINNGTVKIFITDVVEGEVRNHISKYSKEVIKEIQKFNTANHTRFVKHLVDPPINGIINSLMELKENIIESSLLREYEEFKKSARVTVITSNSVSADEILKLYFGRLAPFGENQKKEFPDAISLLALSVWCKKNNERFYVVSENKDFKNFCDGADTLFYLPDLSNLLEIVTEFEQESAEPLHDLIKNNIHFIKRDIKNEFGNIELVSTDYDADAKFSNIEVIDVDILDWHIIYLDKNYLTLEITSNISFEAEVSENDYSTAYYDNEEDKYFFVERTEYSIDEEVKIEVSVDYAFYIESPKLWEDFTLTNLSFKPDTIELELDRYDYEK